jgi:hypothetical protein
MSILVEGPRGLVSPPKSSATMLTSEIRGRSSQDGPNNGRHHERCHFCSRTVGERASGMWGGTSPCGIQPQPPQGFDDEIGAIDIGRAVGGADALQTALQVDNEA